MRHPRTGRLLSMGTETRGRKRLELRGWNPHFLAYCAELRRLPGDVREAPGGMGGFLRWCGARWREWYAIIGCGGMPTQAVGQGFRWYLSRRIAGLV